jgi:hypothetical protein
MDSATAVTQNDLIAFVSDLPGVAVVTASEANGAPEIAWGDSFFFYDPDDEPKARRMPFATIVIKDYPGFDTASNLDRPGVFRLNIDVGRTAFEKLIGHPPAAHAGQHDRFDYTATDRLLPHPAYAAQAWVCVLNPGDSTSAQVRTLLTDAHARAARRHRRHT